MGAVVFLRSGSHVVAIDGTGASTRGVMGVMELAIDDRHQVEAAADHESTVGKLSRGQMNARTSPDGHRGDPDPAQLGDIWFPNFWMDSRL